MVTFIGTFCAPLANDSFAQLSVPRHVPSKLSAAASTAGIANKHVAPNATNLLLALLLIVIPHSNIPGADPAANGRRTGCVVDLPQINAPRSPILSLNGLTYLAGIPQITPELVRILAFFRLPGSQREVPTATGTSGSSQLDLIVFPLRN
jgi:hypothetical protein